MGTQRPATTSSNRSLPSRSLPNRSLPNRSFPAKDLPTTPSIPDQYRKIADWSSEQLADHLSGRLTAAASAAERPAGFFAPELAYGRHRGPAWNSSRIAAVAITLFKHDQHSWVIPLTLRPNSLIHHGGQVCFPGGQVEPGETMLQAALREFTEELGVQPKIKHVCGELPIHYVYASDNQVHPAVLIIDSPRQAWKPDPAEVAQVILLPLSVLFDPDCLVKVRRSRDVIDSDGQPLGQVQFQASAFLCPQDLDVKYDIQGKNTDARTPPVWGATAMMLWQLAQLLQ